MCHGLTWRVYVCVGVVVLAVEGVFFQKLFYVHTSFLLLLLFLCCVSGVGGLVIIIVYVCIYVCICMCICFG